MNKQQLAAYTKNPNVKIMLDVIGKAEGAKNGYYTAFGGGKLDDLTNHPNERHEFTQKDGTKNYTTAAGKYQFLKGTWDDLQKRLGLPNFGPESQDMAAVALLNQNGALPSVLAGDFDTALAKSGTTWASLPSSPYPQNKRDSGFIANALASAAQAILPSAQAGELPAGVQGQQRQPLSRERMQSGITKALSDGKTPDEIISMLESNQGVKTGIDKARADGKSNADILQIISGKPVQPAQQEQPGIGDRLLRQVGLTARAGLTGLGTTAQVFSDPIRLAVNPALKAVGLPTAASAGNTMGGLADTLGLPKPANSKERVAQDIAGAMAGGGAFAKGAGLLGQFANSATAKGLLSSLADAPALQILSAGGSGGGAGAVRELGGSPLAQAGVGLAAGMLTPYAGSHVASRATRFTAPRADVQKSINEALSTRGIDYNDLSAGTKVALQNEVGKAAKTGQELSADSIARLATMKETPNITPLRGSVSQKSPDITEEKNLAKIGANSDIKNLQRLSNVENDNNQALIQNMNRLGADTPLTQRDAGEAITGAVRSLDDPVQMKVKEAYKIFGDQATDGRIFDNGFFSRAANDSIDEKMLNSHLPNDIRKTLNSITAEEMPFTASVYKQFDQKLTTAAADANIPGKGQERAAILSVQKALRDTPVLDSANKQTKELYEQARNLAKDRFMKLDKKAAPGLWEAVINDAPPDKFVHDFIIGSSKRNTLTALRNLGNELKKDPSAFKAARDQIALHLKNKALAGTTDEIGNFSASNFNKALNAIGRDRLSVFFSKDDINSLYNIARTSKYLAAQPAGSAVNNAGTASMLMGKFYSVMGKFGKVVPVVGPLAEKGLSSIAASRPFNLSQGLVQDAVIPNVSFSQSIAGPAAVGGLLGGAGSIREPK